MSSPHLRDSQKVRTFRGMPNRKSKSKFTDEGRTSLILRPVDHSRIKLITEDVERTTEVKPSMQDVIRIALATEAKSRGLEPVS